MQLTAIRHYVPERVVSRDETTELFRHYSRPYYRNDEALEETMRVIDKLLDIGQFRQTIVRGHNEPFYLNFIEMTRQMIDQSGVDPKDIGTVVYCGASRGYMEPATACQMAAALGLKKAEFFDVIDACNGWSRSARIVDSLLRCGASQHILVLSLEFSLSPTLRTSPDKGFGDFHHAYSIRNPSEIDWRMWSATIGEAGVATLWSKDDDSKWYFDYDCECEEYRDCAFTLTNHRDYDFMPMVLDEVHGGEPFYYAYANKISESIRSHLLPLMRKAQPWLDEAKIVVPHSLPPAIFESVFREVGVHEKAIYSFSRYGNITSCGVPSGIVMAIREGKLNRGDRVILTPTGSGSSTGVISFTY